MTREILIYGLKQGETRDYMEDLLACFPVTDKAASNIEKVKAAADDSLARWDNENGPAEDYKEFFFDCFLRLAGHYPAPSVASDYDKSVIFAAIEKGEELDANGGTE